jgi:hypothetical protein
LIPRWTSSSNSSNDEKAGGSPLRGKASKSFTRVEAKPVSRPCQNGEFAESASSSGSHVRSAFETAIACCAVASPTWTCRPKISPRSATHCIDSISSR